MNLNVSPHHNLTYVPTLKASILCLIQTESYLDVLLLGPRFISVGFYPARNYQPLAEIGNQKSNPIILTDQHIKTLSEHLPAQLDALWLGEFYNVLDEDFKMNTASPYKTAILSVGEKKHRRSIFLKLHELRYLSYIFFMVQNQLVKYTEAMPDVMNYVLSAISSTTFVEPPPNANKTFYIINCSKK